jgi:E-phenylitaconyl-CoA hydratase
MGEFVDYQLENHVAKIVFNRPDRLNAFNGQMGQEFQTALLDFDNDDDAWVAIISGTGRSFCAGRDIKAQVETGEATLPRYSYEYNIFGVVDTDKPMIAAVNGFAIGLGWYITVGCDFRIAAESAQFGMAEIPTGLMGPYWFSAVESLPWCIGAELTLIGDRIDAQRAYQYGLVNEVVPDDRLQAAAQSWADRILALPPQHVYQTKALMRSMRNMPDAPMLDREVEARTTLNALEDTMEAARAFAEKRTPKFQGR